jgi:hypothetical protein
METLIDNSIKWSSIDLMIQYLLGDKKNQAEKLIEKALMVPVIIS